MVVPAGVLRGLFRNLGSFRSLKLNCIKKPNKLHMETGVIYHVSQSVGLLYCHVFQLVEYIRHLHPLGAMFLALIAGDAIPEHI